MTIKTLREILHKSPGPYEAVMASGEVIKIPHIDYVALPGPAAEAEEEEPIVGLYLPGNLAFLDLAHLNRISIPRKKGVR